MLEATRLTNSLTDLTNPARLFLDGRRTKTFSRPRLLPSGGRAVISLEAKIRHTLKTDTASWCRYAPQQQHKPKSSNTGAGQAEQSRMKTVSHMETAKETFRNLCL